MICYSPLRPQEAPLVVRRFRGRAQSEAENPKWRDVLPDADWLVIEIMERDCLRRAPRCSAQKRMAPLARLTLTLTPPAAASVPPPHVVPR